ncbi:hypothetical protein [Nocardia mexicana]|uniref:Uncharacterized protein n=1 Tax=Nocardia mexicana TaxID=279262 RepID=A0A370HIF5_9NOCA|nr:hypothetical protein [Nocardia mexicana]RDI55249.1 hypothetical protein DFR68_10182 [Nocardia mexicana]
MMATRNPHRIDIRQITLALLSGFVAIWALAGAAGLISGAIDLGATVEERIPFDSPVFAAVALALMVGIPMTFTTVLVARTDPRAPAVAMIAGALLVGWIIVQIYTIEVFSWLQPVCVMAGLVVISLSMTLPSRFPSTPPPAGRFTAR